MENDQNVERTTNSVVVDAPNEVKKDIVFRDKPKKNVGVILGMVFLVLVALGGVGFGVWAMMDGNNRVEAAKKECTSVSGDARTKCNVPDDEKSDDGAKAEEIPIVDMAGYIYVGEWGLKIKIPDSLNFVSYEFKHIGGEGRVEATSLTVTGTPASELSNFANPYENEFGFLGSVGRTKKGAFDSMTNDESLKECGFDSRLVFSDNEYNYCVSLSQAYYSTSAEEIELEKQARTIIGEMLGNAENYSKL